MGMHTGCCGGASDNCITARRVDAGMDRRTQRSEEYPRVRAVQRQLLLQRLSTNSDERRRAGAAVTRGNASSLSAAAKRLTPARFSEMRPILRCRVLSTSAAPTMRGVRHEQSNGGMHAGMSLDLCSLR